MQFGKKYARVRRTCYLRPLKISRVTMLLLINNIHDIIMQNWVIRLRHVQLGKYNHYGQSNCSRNICNNGTYLVLFFIWVSLQPFAKKCHSVFLVVKSTWKWDGQRSTVLAFPNKMASKRWPCGAESTAKMIFQNDFFLCKINENLKHIFKVFLIVSFS